MWMTLAGPLLNLLTGFFKGDGGQSKAAGMGNGLMFYGSIAGGLYWLLSDSAAIWTVTLNARELAGVGLITALIVEWVRRVPPPTL